MNKTLLVLIVLLSPVGAFGQTIKDLPSLNSVRTPNSPAFSILGVQPTSVERPNTPADLAISMDNATDGFSTFPKNYAIEFSPYWMGQGARSLTWKEDVTRDLENSILRTLSFSFATTTKKVNTREVLGLSYGFRFLVSSGRLSKKSQMAIDSLEAKLREASVTYNNMIEEEKKVQDVFQKNRQAATTNEERAALVSTYNEERRRINAMKDRQINERDKADANGKDQVQDFAPQRTGLVIEVAFASGYKSDTVSSELARNGYGFWLTPSYVLDDYSLVGVFRRLKDSLSNESTEYGFRLVYHKQRYSLSAEYLKGEYSNAAAGPNRERFSLLFEYVLTKDLWLSLSFGQDNKNLGGQTALFNTIGLRYNIHGDRFKLGGP